MGFELDWDRLLPAESYRFRMGLRPGDAARFFAPTDEHDALVAERERWLGEAAAEHSLLEPEGHALLDEAWELAAGWSGSLTARSSGAASTPLGCAVHGAPTPAGEGPPALPENGDDQVTRAVGVRHTSGWESGEQSHRARCQRLGSSWEPDFLLLRAGSDGAFRFVGGVVCFPSGWSPREKLGRTVTEIHGVVPTLNPALGHQIEAFLGRINPGSGWERANWGLSRGAALNRHPGRHLPAIEAGTPFDEIFLRVEHQIFFRLPRTLGLLFGIRLSLHSLGWLMTQPEAVAGLRRALTTMPDSIAAYKGLGGIRLELAQRLEGSEGTARG